jgi:hypothetical protein
VLTKNIYPADQARILDRVEREREREREREYVF